jgi:hypothetical protein
MPSFLKVKLTGELLQLFGTSWPWVQRGALAAAQSARRGDLRDQLASTETARAPSGSGLKLGLESGTGRTATSAAVTLAYRVDPRISIRTIK